MADSVPGGYNGEILRVDLSKERVDREKIDGEFCRKYLGGTGFIVYCLLKETRPGLDPLGPENRLVFALGPLTGLSLGGSARHTVGAKSPLTGGIAKAEAGEYWGSQLKRAGFDALIIQGKAKRPVYLWIHRGEAEISDASHLWGKATKETQETIRSELADDRIRVAMIGPAGENRVRFACVMHGLFDAAGRGGMGAVMGSKNLKAVAVRGDRLPPVAGSDGVKLLATWLKENLDLMKSFSEFGTGGPMPRFEKLGNLPVRNFRDGGFPAVDKISAETLKQTIRIGMDSCFACPVRCKKTVEVKDPPYQVDPSYGGPEYETLGALGSACGIDNLAAIARANQLCNAYSLDTISTGMTIASAMECYENGLLTQEQLGGLELKFGNADAMLKMIDLIAVREGIGDLLAEGCARAAESIGKGADAFAMHVKKQEIPMHEPRLSKALGLGYMVNPHGADHMDSMIDIFYSSFGQQPVLTIPDAVPIGLEPAHLDDIGPRKVALFKLIQSKRIICDSLVLCDFLPYSYTQISSLLSAVTGWETSVAEHIRISERILTMCRMFNVREGLSEADDRLPSRFFSPTRNGPLADKALDVEEMEKAKHYYYRLMGWDDKGVPLPERLEELGIDHLTSKA
ncbi:MAG: aldehyde ferredoxin oxidoreductase family protein [Deltaproteobacteria bacterium]|nr:aldehyde ferredoxin oxidoreductase family protein [Deltaproteobacteria bacterium]